MPRVHGRDSTLCMSLDCQVQSVEATSKRFMAAKDTVVIVLAAGKGTRLRSDVAKVLHRVGGRSLVEHVVRACQPLKAAETIVVVGFQREAIAAAVVRLARKPFYKIRNAERAMQFRRRGVRFAAARNLQSWFRVTRRSFERRLYPR